MSEAKFCSNCGKPVIIGVSEKISENPSFTSDGVKTKSVGLLILNKEFKKTHIMNIAGAIGWAIVGVALFLNKMNEAPAWALAIIVAMYILLVVFPAYTARALSPSGSYALKRRMLWANWAFIALWCFAFVAELFIFGGHQLGMGIAAALAFVLPQVINIRALRSTMATQSANIASNK